MADAVLARGQAVTDPDQVLLMHLMQRHILANKRMERMTSSAIRRVLQSSVRGALLVTAHPHRWRQ